MIRLYSILLMVFLMSGCGGRGIIYTSTVQPFVTDFNHTPTGSKKCVIRDHTIQINNVSVEWIAEHFAETLKKAGIKKIHYSEMRTFSVLFGIYKRKTLIVYGD